MEDDSDPPVIREKSAVALDIENLQDTVKRLASERDRLPQPLFWSLFHTRLKAIRQQKEISRVVRETLGDS